MKWSIICATRVGRERAHRAGDRAAHAHRQHVAEHPDRTTPSSRTCRECRRSPRRSSAARCCAAAARVDELAVASPDSNRARSASSVCAIAFDVLREVEHRAVVEEAAPLRVEPDEVEVILQVAPGLGEDAAQDRRDREDRRPHVEAEAVAFEDARPCRRATRCSKRTTG